MVRSFSYNTCSAGRFGFQFAVDNSDEIVEDIDGVKNVVVLTIENGTMLVSGVLVMISAMLADSILKFVVDNSDETVEDIDGV